MKKLLVSSLREMDSHLKESLSPSHSMPRTRSQDLTGRTSRHQTFLREVQEQIHLIDAELGLKPQDDFTISTITEIVRTPEKQDQEEKKEAASSEKEGIKSLKNRLVGAVRTIRHLEAELKATKEQFKLLEEDSGTSPGFSESRKPSKTRELQMLKYGCYRSLGEKDAQIREERRTVARVQGLNRLLVAKLKEMQPPEDLKLRLSVKSAASKRLKSDLKNVQQVNASLEDLLTTRETEIQDLTRRYDALMTVAKEFEEKASAVYYAAHTMTETLKGSVERSN